MFTETKYTVKIIFIQEVYNFKSQQYNFFFCLNMNRLLWQVILSDGKTLIFKGACFFLWK